MLTADEVIWGYRYVLGRDPESRSTIERQSADNADWATFRRRLISSPEFQSKGLPISTGRSKWVAADILGGQRLLWLDLVDEFVSRGCLNDDYEQLESDVVRRHLREGHVFVDVGANIGWFTLLASPPVGAGGRVHAFEPRKPTVDYLRRSVAMNDLGAIVVVHEFGLDRMAGQAKLCWKASTRNPGHSYLGTGEGHAAEEIQEVRLESLDRLRLGRIDMIKLDVEGAEMRVLEGGEATLTLSRPVALCEIYPAQLRAVSKAAPADVFGWFKTRGYRSFIVDRQRNGEEINDFPTDWRKELINVAFVPRDRQSSDNQNL